MNTFLKFATVAALTIGASGIPVVAFATDTSNAIQLCEKNPNCAMKLEGNRIIMTVKGTGPKYIVDCPMINGTCTAQRPQSSRSFELARES